MLSGFRFGAALAARQIAAEVAGKLRLADLVAALDWIAGRVAAHPWP